MHAYDIFLFTLPVLGFSFFFIAYAVRFGVKSALQSIQYEKDNK